MMNEKDVSEREVSDGWTTRLACGPACDLQVVRPGSVQCNYTDAACPNACACPEGPYIGTQEYGYRVRCERCGCPPVIPPAEETR